MTMQMLQTRQHKEVPAKIRTPNIRLAEARRKAGLTQSEVAGKLHIPHHSYQNYEAGRREPKASMGVRIARILGTTSEMLFG